MVTVSRRGLLPLLAPIPVPTAFSILAPNPIQAGKTPSFLLPTVAPTERLSPPVTWRDDLERRLKTYFTKKYSAYNFALHTQEHAGQGVRHCLSRIGNRAANGRRSHRRLQ